MRKLIVAFLLLAYSRQHQVRVNRDERRSQSILARLTQNGDASTFRRLGKSAHVADLQLIFYTTSFLMLVALLFTAAAMTCLFFCGVIKMPGEALKTASGFVGGVIGPGLLVLAWTYQRGSARLGVVDLFSCEIATLCRVFTVSRTAERLVALYDEPPHECFCFKSTEQYAPVFEANSKDLELLEARVVAHVTEFYTYLKAFRDYLRMLGNFEKPSNHCDPWRHVMTSVIYMQFLMLESGRKSIASLVEFEPEQVQYATTILLSELVVYKKLREICESEWRDSRDCDARYQRLVQRESDYRELVPAIFNAAHRRTFETSSRRETDADRWAQADRLTNELNFRYHDVFQDWLVPLDPVIRTA
jgi:hypothetical protein